MPGAWMSIGAAVLAIGVAGGYDPREGAVVRVETLANTVDGSVLRGCRLQGEAEGARPLEWWVAFGEIRPAGDGSFAAVSAAIRCDHGSSRQAEPLFGRVLGVPYLIAEVKVSPRKGALQATVSVREFSEWEAGGRASYRAAGQRAIDLGAARDAVVPLWIADAPKKEHFRVAELFLRLDARPFGERKAAYGSIAVTSDTPGGWLLLNGGPVGRILEDRPTVIENVPIGRREVAVRDLSGREAKQTVVVTPDATLAVALPLREPTASAPETDLVPVGKIAQGHPEYWRVRDGALVVAIPAGEAWMGSAEGEGEENERPRHLVHVSAFRIDKTEVTWRQFRRFARAEGRPLPPAPMWGMPDEYAASNIDWSEATAYCAWVGGRLPTEAEWEKASRGTDGRKYPWGDAWDRDRCNCLDGGSHRPESVGSFPDCVSPYGVLEMPGGVWEWCSDWFGETYDPEARKRDPRGPESGTMRVIRGGGWVNQPTWLRPAYRYRAEPSGRHPNQGFRCVQDERE